MAVMRYSLILTFLANVPHLQFKWICGVVVDTIVFLIHHIFIHCSNPLENRGAAEISNLNKLRLGVQSFSTCFVMLILEFKCLLNFGKLKLV